MREFAGFEEYAAGDDDDDEVGAAFSMINRLRAKKGKPPLRKLPRTPNVATGPSGLFSKRLPLGGGRASFTATSGTSLSIEVEPQRGYTPRRLVIAVARTGTTATGLILLTSMTVGDVQQLPASNGCPVEMFSADVTDGELDLTPCVPGQKITLTFTISAAPTTTDTVVLSAGFYGAAVGQ